MGLSAEHIVHSMGIASMGSSGTMGLIFGSGSDLRGMYAGFTAQGAVQAVERRGMTGITNLFEGEAGQFKVYFNGDYNRAKMLENLGTRFLSGAMLPTQPSSLRGRTRSQSIRSTRSVSMSVASCSACAHPAEHRQAPGTLIDAKFSLPFLVALSLARVRIGIADLSSEALRDERVLALARKVVPIPDPSFNWTLKLPDRKVEVVMKDGRIFERLGSQVPGTAERPMTWAELGQKFSDCAPAAVRPVAVNRTADALELVRRMETCGDVTELVCLMTIQS